MAYRCKGTDEQKAGAYDFRPLEVVLAKRPGLTRAVRTLTVDNHWETLTFVQEHIDLFVANMASLRRHP